VLLRLLWKIFHYIFEVFIIPVEKAVIDIYIKPEVYTVFCVILKHTFLLE